MNLYVLLVALVVGKSTLIDIISQIHIQDEGILKADDQIINKQNLSSWQKIRICASNNQFI